MFSFKTTYLLLLAIVIIASFLPYRSYIRIEYIIAGILVLLGVCWFVYPEILLLYSSKTTAGTVIKTGLSHGTVAYSYKIDGDTFDAIGQPRRKSPYRETEKGDQVVVYYSPHDLAVSSLTPPGEKVSGKAVFIIFLGVIGSNYFLCWRRLTKC